MRNIINNKSNAFTVSELVVVLCVIGVLTVLTLTSMGNKVDRHKALFKKAYSLIERTVVELVNDETYYPYDYNNFGFKETTNVKIKGPEIYTCGNSATPTCDKLVKFCQLFSNNLNLNSPLTITGTTSCSFITNDNMYWSITKKADANGFVFFIDVNGIDKVPNLPAALGNLAADGRAKNRDRFFIYVRDDGKMSLPVDDTLARSYLRSSNMNQEETN